MKNIIRLENIWKIYNEGEIKTIALREVFLTIEKYEFIAIMGPSGSGKSTLLHIIGCLDKPSKGKYFLEGKNIGRLKDDDLAKIRNKKIGFVFQSFNLLRRTTVIENVKLPLQYANIAESLQESTAKDALRKVGIKPQLFNKYPNQLSGGEQQRIAIARAIVTNPSIILADEPTGNLDSISGKIVMETFKILNKLKHTIILVTHDKEIAKYANRIINIKDGKIINVN